MESYGELRRDTEIYEEVWVKSFLLQLNMTRELHITLEHEQTRATESYGELRRAMGVAESYGLIF